jgi:hypothetical protein
MKVINIHQRLLPAAPERVGALIDTLASPHDALWPRRDWPRMAFDRPLGVGARGGHGPVRYFVESYTPGQAIRFRFTGPRGFDGWHALEVLDATRQHCVLEHRIEMRARGWARLSWPLFFRPLHDAVVEDALTVAEESLGLAPRAVPWSWYVCLLRWLASPRRVQACQRRTHHAA